jgi:hypothetical protein
MNSVRNTNARTSGSWSEASTTSGLRQARTSWSLSLTLQPFSQTQPPSIKRCTPWSKWLRPQHPFPAGHPELDGLPGEAEQTAHAQKRSGRAYPLKIRGVWLVSSGEVL